MTEHTGLKNLYNQVIQNRFGWDRWGLLSVLSDYVLKYVEGDLLEIGCGETSIIFSRLAEKYGRQCYHVEYSKSGVENMKNTKGYFGKNSQVFNMKSSEFFYQEKFDDEQFALVFIDGDHSYKEASVDFWYSQDYLANKGFIFLHDTLPPSKDWTVPHKCGDVYKLRIELETVYNFEIFTFPFSAFDVGLTMVTKKQPRLWEDQDGPKIQSI